jgi:hypothetical protein
MPLYKTLTEWQLINQVKVLIRISPFCFLIPNTEQNLQGCPFPMLAGALQAHMPTSSGRKLHYIILGIMNNSERSQCLSLAQFRSKLFVYVP